MATETSPLVDDSSTSSIRPNPAICRVQTPDLALQDAVARIKSICEKSEGRSQYFPYGGGGYTASITHYFESSTELASGAVQPGSVEDIQSIVKVIADTRVPFAIKCGGHSTNPGFSSTKGIQIYMVRLNKITLHKEERLVDVGAGCLFEELYEALAVHGQSIVGGTRWAGVGVTGWILGGGYSVKTSRYGLGIDSLTAVKVVLPNGEFTEASKTKNQDLFFALKGGGNNFGIVTELTLKTHDQGDIYDFTLTYKEDMFDQVKVAILDVIATQDSKINIVAKFQHYNEPHHVILTVQCIYDGTYPIEDPFAELVRIPHSGNAPMKCAASLNPHVAGTSEPEYRKPPMFGKTRSPRGRWGNVMIDEFTPEIIDELEKVSYEAAKGITKYGGTDVSIGLWPFKDTMFDRATPSAWPHEKGKPSCPINVYFTWEGKQHDAYWVDTMKTTLKMIREAILRERPSSRDLPCFISASCVETTTIEDIYGNNLEVLKQLRRKYDEHGVMDLTGGFRIPRAAGDEKSGRMRGYTRYYGGRATRQCCHLYL